MTMVDMSRDPLLGVADADGEDTHAAVITRAIHASACTTATADAWTLDLTQLVSCYCGLPKQCVTAHCTRQALRGSKGCSDHTCCYGVCRDVVADKTLNDFREYQAEFKQSFALTANSMCAPHTKMVMCCKVWWFICVSATALALEITAFSIVLVDIFRPHPQWHLDIAVGTSAIACLNVATFYVTFPCMRRLVTCLWDNTLRCCCRSVGKSFRRCCVSRRDAAGERKGCLDAWFAECNPVGGTVVVIWGMFLLSMMVTLFTFSTSAGLGGRLCLLWGVGCALPLTFGTIALVTRCCASFAGREVSACDWVLGCDTGPELDDPDVLV
jgi:hypothetical protein